ncbi:uncharacterized protein [Chelonus insularis]|uniref:uncharacterized protein n=1 Tax=Chelonus insularis TaxID=460826 RepID=UPI00158E8B2F|nr:uncharacterized protein LOC118068398 [Chelonus insularis]
MAWKSPIMIILFMIILVLKESNADTKYFVKLNTKETQIPSSEIINKTRNIQDDKVRAFHNVDDASVIREILKANQQRRNSFIEASTFDPNVLNKFLGEYANKIRSTTDPNEFPYSYETTKESSITASDVDASSSEISTSTEDFITINGSTISLEQLNDTIKRNKFHNQNHNDNRNGWVTLEAIPWSKSKISKWQANPNSQRPWSDNKWDNKLSNSKPWTSDYSSRPPFDNNKSWYDKQKPHLSDFQSEKLRPSTRPSYPNNYYDSNPGQAQKWPPEKPSSPWDDFANAHRPHSDIIITDDRPSNFPVSDWDKYDQVTRPTYSSFNDRYDTESYEEANNNWPGSNYPHKYDSYEKPTFSRPNRPHFSGQYEYENRYPPSHPSSGDGQWVLLSTNRGYSRQRSLKYNSNGDTTYHGNGTVSKLPRGERPDPAVEVVSSKRQVRLTVLPSINGTNTTTSHGGLLEVEKTFKTVEESRREYEAAKLLAEATSTSSSTLLGSNALLGSNSLIGSNFASVIKKRPVTRGVGARPSNSAVLAAVSAGMLPATMAMMIPIMLGRKKRSLDQMKFTEFFYKRRE